MQGGSLPLAQRVKRGVDVALVIVSAPLWVPVCALLALIVWSEDRESPLFLQHRIGRGGASFTAWKLRTMVPDAEAVLRARLAGDAALRREWDTYFRVENDPRRTRVGRVLRRFSLDELPQLVNVLKGDMALVGPRPLTDYHVATLPADVREVRQRVRPGLTGLWQVSGRSDVGNDAMAHWDTYYVHNWSLRLDARILVRTVRVVLTGSGAY